MRRAADKESGGQWSRRGWPQPSHAPQRIASRVTAQPQRRQPGELAVAARAGAALAGTSGFGAATAGATACGFGAGEDMGGAAAGTGSPLSSSRAYADRDRPRSAANTASLSAADRVTQTSILVRS
jgi:hypothetical protein